MSDVEEERDHYEHGMRKAQADVAAVRRALGVPEDWGAVEHARALRAALQREGVTPTFNWDRDGHLVVELGIRERLESLRAEGEAVAQQARDHHAEVERLREEFDSLSRALADLNDGALQIEGYARHLADRIEHVTGMTLEDWGLVGQVLAAVRPWMLAALPRKEGDDLIDAASDWMDAGCPGLPATEEGGDDAS